MAEKLEPGKPGRSRPGKSGTRDVGGVDPGPLEDHAIRIPRRLWKDVAKLAIDADTSASALIVTWVKSGMARRGYHYREGDGGAGQGEGTLAIARETGPTPDRAGPAKEEVA